MLLDIIDLNVFINILAYVKIRYITYIDIDVIKQARLVCKTFKKYIDTPDFWNKIYKGIVEYRNIVARSAAIPDIPDIAESMNKSPQYREFLNHYMLLTQDKYINSYMNIFTNLVYMSVNFAGKCTITENDNIIYNGDEEILQGNVAGGRITISTYSNRVYEYLVAIANENLRGFQEIRLPVQLPTIKFLLCKDFTIAICADHDKLRAFAWSIIQSYSEERRTVPFEVFTTSAIYIDYSDEERKIIISKTKDFSEENTAEIDYNTILEQIYINYFNGISQTEADEFMELLNLQN